MVGVVARDPRHGMGDLRRARQTLGRNPLDVRQPWITFQAMDWLEEHLRPQWRVFEYGSGGSTIFYAQRVAHVTSVEHDPAWHGDVVRKLAELGLANCDYRLVEPERPGVADASEDERSTRKEYAGSTFRRYIAAIDDQADASLDAVIVDGRARNGCVARAMPKVKPGGYLILDNSERREYEPGIALLNGWEWRDFRGFGPYSLFSWRTTVFRKG